jgi:hypothetical protein
MADGVSYDVNAFLRTQGSFTTEMGQAARAADTFGSAWGRMGSGLVSVGERVRGTFGALARDFAAGGALAVGGGLVAGIGAATVKGVEFNNTMEQGALGLATMYQTFGVNPAFEKNIELARAMQHELVAIADASPGTTADIMEAYQSLAPGVTGVTQDLERQRALMEKIAVLGFTTGNDYKQLGQDVGRIVTGVAGADVAVFRTLAPTLKEAFKEVTGKEAIGDFAAEFNKVAKANGETALKIFETAIGSIGPEANKAFGESFGGVIATVESRLLKLAGDFGKPLFDSIKNVAVNDLLGDGPFSEEAFGKLREVAFFSGGVIANAFENAASRMIEMVDYMANNWQSIAATIREAGVLAGVAIKSAIVVAVTRHFVGSGMMIAGKLAEAFDKVREVGPQIGQWIGGQIKQTHMALGRGMKGGGSGLLGGMGRGMGGLLGREKGAGFNRFGLDKPMLQVASLVATVGSLGTVAVMAGTAIGAIGVVVAGATAYFTEHWNRITGDIVVGLESGSITLVPLITSLYTFYARLEMVGQAIFGGSSAVGAMNSGLSALTTIIDLVSGALSWFVYGLSIMVGGWALLKLGMLGVMKMILGIVEVANTLGAVSDETAARANRNYNRYAEGVDATFHKADQLASASKKISEAQLSPMDYAAAQEKAKQLEKSLMDALSGTGKGKDGKGGGRAHKPSVKIDKVVVEVKLDDPDPDRVFSTFLPKFVALADRRIQPYDAIEAGT